MTDNTEPAQGDMTLVNATDQRMTVFLEPWGSSHRLPAGGRMRLATQRGASGPAIGEIIVGPQQITLHAGPGAIIERIGPVTGPVVAVNRGAP